MFVNESTALRQEGSGRRVAISVLLVSVCLANREEKDESRWIEFVWLTITILAPKHTFIFCMFVPEDFETWIFILNNLET